MNSAVPYGTVPSVDSMKRNIFSLFCYHTTGYLREYVPYERIWTSYAKCSECSNNYWQWSIGISDITYSYQKYDSIPNSEPFIHPEDPGPFILYYHVNYHSWFGDPMYLMYLMYAYLFEVEVISPGTLSLVYILMVWGLLEDFGCFKMLLELF